MQHRLRFLAAVAALFLPVATAGPAAAAGPGSKHCGILVYGAIEDKYLSFGAQGGPLGCPEAMETDAARDGRREDFRGGTIYWHPGIGAHVVWGRILERWTLGGREHGLGFPLTDELSTSDGAGRYNEFESGSIYWHPDTGAHAIHGAIRQEWVNLGRERSCLGYPVSEELAAGGDGRYQNFQHGSIFWTPTSGAVRFC